MVMDKKSVKTGAYIEIPDSTSRDQIETVLTQFLKNNALINKQKTVRDELIANSPTSRNPLAGTANRVVLPASSSA